MLAALIALSIIFTLQNSRAQQVHINWDLNSDPKGDLDSVSEITLEGFKLILWGDLKIMMESSTEENDQKLKDGTVIHMLVERRYPLSKDLLQRMLDFGLKVKVESTVALHL
ncbi:hypothetical protein Tco_1255567, partial [Tanacetum coccineum]